MEKRNEMPKEVRKVETPIVEAIPEKYLKKIQEAQRKKRENSRNLLEITIGILDAVDRQKQFSDSIRNAEKSLKANMESAFKKMRLDKKKDFSWRYDKQGSFVGTPRPPVVKPEWPKIAEGGK